MSKRRSAWWELAVVLHGFSALTILFTYPLAFHLGSVARIDNGDGQFAIWNVAWVARALLRDPRHVFDANIFYPHHGTLAYSETNLGAGALAVPVYWATGNGYAAHNFSFLISFVLSGAGMYYLARYLTSDRRAAVVAAICYAYCPYVFGHTPHIQLLMTAGLPFGMLALHRAMDQPTASRGAALGLVMAAQAFFCGYYAIFLMLAITFAVVVIGLMRGLWRDRPFWIAIGTAVVVAIACSLPVLLPYLKLQHDAGFVRSLRASREFSAHWHSYLSSSSYLHRWVLAGSGGELLFPGFITLTFGVAGGVSASRRAGRLRELAIVYTGLGILALWASFGPSAGLYSVLYKIVTAFTFLRAPGRFGLIVDFALSVLAGVAVSELLQRCRRSSLVAAGLACLAAAELLSAIPFQRVPPVDEAYRVLATLPPGPVLELPVYSRHFAHARERYMLNSTIHWMPLIDAYSDFIPVDFAARVETYAQFPSRESLALLMPMGARYAVFHPNEYNPAARVELTKRIAEFSPYLCKHASTERVWLYEISGCPRSPGPAHGEHVK